MSFKVPSSSQPSTPGKTPNGSKGGFLFSVDHPSTTPAGAPAGRSIFSTTPAVPPPSQIFGSSALGSGTGLFSKPQPGVSSKPVSRGPFKVSPKTAFGGGRAAKPSAFGRDVKPAFLGAHRVEQPETDEDEYEDTTGDEDGEGEQDDREVEEEEDDDEASDEDGEAEEEYDDEDGEGEDDEENYDEDEADEEEDDEVEPVPTSFGKPRKPDLMQSTGSAFDWEGLAGEETAKASPKGLKRSRDVTTASLIQSIEADLPPAKRRVSTLPRIAKDLAKSRETARVDDPHDLILATETAVQRLSNAARAPHMSMHYEEVLESAWAEVPPALIRIWSTKAKSLEQDDSNVNIGIGPSEDSNPVTKAAFVASMLLILHHQPHARSQSLANVALQQSLANSAALLSLSDDTRVAYPKVFVDLLENSHDTCGQGLISVLGYRPNPTAHQNFWDAIVTATLRGKLGFALEILREADFGCAYTARQEGQGRLGYQGPKLAIIQQAVSRSADILRAAPAVRDQDWEVTSHDWHLFRKNVEFALAELTEIAEGGKPRSRGPLVEAQHFGITSPNGRSRDFNNAESQLPTTIYESLKVMYGILLGRAPEILSSSQDWLEATLALGIWWNGDDEADVQAASLKASRRSLHGRPRSANQPRAVDTDPPAAYRRRLALAVDLVTNGPEDESLMVNTNNAVEVGLGSVFEGNVEGVIALLQIWSLPITSAVLEIAKWGGWYESPPTDSPPEGFDDSDLMVLSYARPERGLVKDDVLLSYSDQLFEIATLKDPNRGDSLGWELAVQVSSRLDDETAARKRVDWLLSRIEVTTAINANRVINTCVQYRLEKHARAAAKRHADHVASNSHDYGSALIYYARAHESRKCKEVLDLLISMCLVRSSAYPNFEERKNSRGEVEVDLLPGLLLKPKETLKFVSSQLVLDEMAIEILTTNLSGYATLRRFYDLRDEQVAPERIGSRKSGLQYKARRRAAVKALLACIQSSSHAIQGGLFDRDAENVVEHDVLLALLAEASAFVHAEDRPLNMKQLMLVLRAVEDLQTVHSRIRKQCEECFDACLEAKYDAGAERLDPREMMKKSVSGATESSGFSLIGSEITGSSSAGGKSGRSKKTDKTVRGWDWRDNFERNMTGNQLLDHMRKGIAEEVALTWIEEM